MFSSNMTFSVIYVMDLPGNTIFVRSFDTDGNICDNYIHYIP